MKRISFGKTVVLLAASSLLGLGACAEDEMGDGENGPAGGKADEADDLDPSDFKCQRISNESRRSGNILEQLSDPLADTLKLDGCARGFRDLNERMKRVDSEGCDSGEGAGLTTFVVTEHGQVTSSEVGSWTARGDTLRTVTSRRCNGRQNFEYVTSVFGNDRGQLSDTAEVIAFDRNKKEFNYYEVSGSAVTFFGSSTDIMTGDAGRCKSCHTSGGLVMKETRNPWIFWESGAQTPGAKVLVDANKDLLGSKSGGASFEGLVRGGNGPWNDTKVALLADRESGFTPEDMLRPLFCTTEINTDTAATSTGSAPSDFPQNQLADCRLYGSCSSTHSGESGGVRIKGEDYEAVASDPSVRQRVTGTGEDDTIFAFAFAEPSLSEIQYVEKLVSAGVLDDELVADILAVEATKPVFSDLRCGILNEIELKWSDIEAGPAGDDGTPTEKAENIRAALQSKLENLSNPSEAANWLLANLRAEENRDAHRQATTDYIKACNDRAANEGQEYIKDVFRFAAWHRKRALALPVMEDKEALMATLSLSTSEMFWDPQTCALVDAPVFPVFADPDPEPEPEPEPDPDPDPTDGDSGDSGDGGGDGDNQCEARCGTDLEFDPNASCQCDTECMNQSPPDCCPGMICG